ncbi:Uncharacterised protein [Nocardia farcinica]|uniref:Uncharacterized protein n=1 Tax=Nocardia farcinica TaxID=37329 RepID=A0A449H3C5_NOCFR|nr:hypothetical protein [Nocardia farcinica]VFA92509.1 Uncharacterised protein [Nocardia farcinica]
MSPTPQQLEVALGSLRNDARTWAEQSTQMASVKPKVEALTFTRVEAGLFQVIVGANDELVPKFSLLAEQAASSFEQVADVLIVCANTYQAEDEAGKHRLDNLW